MRILISGTLHESPQQRTAASGHPFTTAKLKDDSVTPHVWSSVVAFGDLAETLAKMPKGAALAVSGRCTVDAYLKDGEPRASFSITADQLATLKKAKKGVS